jgi:hypothetical protein
VNAYLQVIHVVNVVQNTIQGEWPSPAGESHASRGNDQLTGQAHWTDVSDLSDVVVAEACGAEVNGRHLRHHEMLPATRVREKHNLQDGNSQQQWCS